MAQPVDGHRRTAFGLEAVNAWSAQYPASGSHRRHLRTIRRDGRGAGCAGCAAASAAGRAGAGLAVPLDGLSRRFEPAAGDAGDHCAGTGLYQIRPDPFHPRRCRRHRTGRSAADVAGPAAALSDRSGQADHRDRTGPPRRSDLFRIFRTCRGGIHRAGPSRPHPRNRAGGRGQGRPPRHRGRLPPRYRRLPFRRRNHRGAVARHPPPASPRRGQPFRIGRVGRVGPAAGGGLGLGIRGKHPRRRRLCPAPADMGAVVAPGSDLGLGRRPAAGGSRCADRRRSRRDASGPPGDPAVPATCAARRVLSRRHASRQPEGRGEWRYSGL